MKLPDFCELYCGKAGPKGHPELETVTHDEFNAFFERVPMPDSGVGPLVADERGGRIVSGPGIDPLDLEAVDMRRCKLCGGYMMKRSVS